VNRNERTKINELSSDIDDVRTTVDELQSDSSTPADADDLNRIKAALDEASDVADEIEGRQLE
jgi:outer membrane murein-binding lipoprotein Lpp